MSKFDAILYEKVKKTALKRVRIKCDPLLNNQLDFSSVSSYEGFILEENAQTIRIMVIKGGMPTISVPSNTTNIEPETPPCIEKSKIQDFKNYISKLFTEGDPLFENIKKMETLEEIENTLIQNNVTPDKFLGIVRKFINGKLLFEAIEAPGFFQNVGQFAKNAATGAIGAITNAGQTAQKINQLSSNLKSGNYGAIATGVAEKWQQAKEDVLKKDLKRYEWPTGYPKKGENIKIINSNMDKIHNKLITINQVTKVSKQTVYFGTVLGAASTLGPIGVIITMTQDAPNDHAVNVKFTEGSTISQNITKNVSQGDMYVLQYSARTHQFELVEDFLGTASRNGQYKEPTVRCKKTDKPGQIVDDLIVIARLGSYTMGQHFRGKLVTPPEWNDRYGCYVAHATPA